MLTKNCSFCENSKKIIGGGDRGGGGGGSGLGGGVRVDVNEELKFLGIFKKKLGGGPGGRVGRSGWM